jgi:hypothetical protein
MESSGTLGPADTHRSYPSLEETVGMVDSIDGFALWLRTEGRPKSVQGPGPTGHALGQLDRRANTCGAGSQPQPVRCVA